VVEVVEIVMNNKIRKVAVFFGGMLVCLTLVPAALGMLPLVIFRILPDVSATDRYEQTSLHSAVQNGDKELVKMLLDQGADCSVADNNRQTPLRVANTRAIELSKERKRQFEPSVLFREPNSREIELFLVGHICSDAHLSRRIGTTPVLLQDCVSLSLDPPPLFYHAVPMMVHALLERGVDFADDSCSWCLGS